ncbi:putative lysine methyltransferase [Lyophyllum shimeji]|uniref:Lysine methyltransferase n=1 Tax=Lyophyllum shimeji TaxID=47721 RepID=A0A9P3PXM7_LYOSH|nr:putative lysine methyltransferase [Lyophyllum shimeji]
MDPESQHGFRGAVRISSDAERVTDADEEVFLLYSDLQSGAATADTDTFRGLGHVDSRKDTMTITFELKVPTSTASDKPRRHRKTRKPSKDLDKTFQIELAQDKSALRTRKGDTGSVLWKASIDFARLVLQQIHAQASDSLLDAEILKTQHVVELGAGTGLLAIAFASLVQRYTVTDIGALIPLLRKNVASNFDGWPEQCLPSAPGSNVFVEELDWLILNSTIPAHRNRVVDFEPADLILVVDCIYHPSLLPSLLETIDHLTIPARTAVLVVVELRAEDVIREFLELWLSRQGWEIRRLTGLLDRPYAMWLGWRVGDHQ